VGRQAKNRFRNELARELLSTADILERANICPDGAPLKAAANQCLACGGDHWRYNVSNLILRLSPELQTLPTDLISLDCRLNVSVAGLCSEAYLPQDPMMESAIDLVLEGAVQTTGKKYIQSWHFDRHISDVSSSDSVAAHPRYHFHFGGRRMEAFASEIGVPCFDSILLLDGPRIAHAPLDGVLVIDFILSNFIGEKWRTLRNDRGYSQIISASQKRNWKPFVTALANHWSSQTDPDSWLAADVWPQYCRA
jgi:hypothetical protein